MDRIHLLFGGCLEGDLEVLVGLRPLSSGEFYLYHQLEKDLLEGVLVIQNQLLDACLGVIRVCESVVHGSFFGVLISRKQVGFFWLIDLIVARWSDGAAVSEQSINFLKIYNLF